MVLIVEAFTPEFGRKLDDRVYIQEDLDNNLNPNLISRKIGKSHSTV